MSDLTDQTSWTYDKDEFPITRTDGNNHLTRWVYDAAHNLNCVIGPDSTATTCGGAPAASKTSYVYDNNDNPTSRTDADNHIWSFVYDDANRLQSITSQVGKVWSYSYWPNGLLHVKTLPSGSITYDYDPLDRLTSVTYSNAPATPNVTYSYDANGNRTQMTDSSPQSTVNYVYDDLNRMITATRGSDVFSYVYYPGSQLKQVTNPDGSIVGYQDDADERLCTVTIGSITTTCNSPLSTTTTYGYDAANDLRTKTYPASNGYTETLAYDNADRLTSVTNANSGGTLSSYTFGSLDGVGNPKTLTAVSGGSTTTTYYMYDPYDRLTGACNLVNCTGTSLTGLGYTYDPLGNRLTQVQYGTPNVTTTYKYDSDDKLCWTYVGTSSNGCSTPPTGATIYTFSSNGSETTAGQYSYNYDLQNRMISNTAPLGTPTSATYTYDGDGNRLSMTTLGTTTNYLWDTNQPLPLLALERSGGSTLRDYSYGAGLSSMTTGGSNYFYLFDAYSSVANVTSPSGATEWTYRYDPFGGATATKNDPNAPANLMQFDGQFLDSSTGLYNLRARLYDLSTGRFLQIDPAPSSTRDPYTASYVYAHDGPTVMDDPGGRFPWHKFFHELIFHPVGSYKTGLDQLSPSAYAAQQTYLQAVPFAIQVLLAAMGDTGPAPEQECPYGQTPEGRPYTYHYGEVQGPVRNIPGSVVDEVINNNPGKVVEGGKTVYYDPNNNVTVVTGDNGSIVTVHKGPP